MKIITKNKRAYFDYEILDTREAGIVLLGHEVKAIKNGRINISDSIIRIQNRQAHILNMDVPLYAKANYAQIGSYNPKHTRILLLNRSQTSKLTTKTNKTGLTLLPLQVYIDRNHRIKILIGLAKRRRKIQKKQLLKERDTSRQMDKAIKHLGL